MKENDSTLNYLLSIKCKTIETAVPKIIVSAESEEEKRELARRYINYLNSKSEYNFNDEYLGR